MAVTEDGQRRLVLRMVVASLRLMLLHHCHGLGPQCPAQPVQFLDQMRHVGDGVFENEAMEIVRIAQRVIDGEPAAPGMAEQVHLAEPQRLADRLGLLDIAPDGPQRGIVRPVGSACSELVEGDDAVAFLRKTAVRFPQIIAGKPGPAVETEYRLVAAAEAVGDHLEAVDLDLVARVRLHFMPHRWGSE